jgi:hypothetical protein
MSVYSVLFANKTRTPLFSFSTTNPMVVSATDKDLFRVLSSEFARKSDDHEVSLIIKKTKT